MMNRMTLEHFVGSLCQRAPLERSTPEMAQLLTAACDSWSLNRRLLSRAGSYTRTGVYRDRHFEVLLLNWDAGAASAVHDHGGQHCWMLVLDGRLRVDDYVRLDAGERPGFAAIEPRESRVLANGECDLRQGRFDLHRVVATGGVPAISLHVYAAPLASFLVYDERAQRCRPMLGTYDDTIALDDTVVSAL